MALQIKNRREDVYITDVPPVITDLISLESELSTDGFVKTSDYPSTSVAGVIKLNPNRAVSHANGALQSVVVSADNYDSLNNAAFISKGTLDNVINNLLTSAIANLCGALEEDAVGTKYALSYVEKTNDGYTFVGTKTPPTP